MAEIDLGKEHPSAELRIHRRDEIAYYLIGDRAPVGIHVPQLLRTPMLSMLSRLPKSGYQLVNPLGYQQYHIEHGTEQAVNFGVIFSDSFPTRIKFLTSEPRMLHVFLWHTLDSSSINSLKEIAAPFIIFPANAIPQSDLINAGIDKTVIVNSYEQILKRIESKVITDGFVGQQDINECKNFSKAYADEFHKKLHPRAALPFAPLRVNLSQLCQIFGQFVSDYWEEIPNDFTKRPIALASSFNAVRDVLGSISNFKSEGYSFTNRLPSAIFAFPSLSPVLRQQMANGIKLLPTEFIKLGKDVLLYRIAEQETKTYCHMQDILSLQQKEVAIQFGLSELASYTQFFDVVGYLHSSFKGVPYLRAPFKGTSLASEHSFFAPKNLLNATSAIPDKSMRKRVFRFGRSLSSSVDSELKKAIRDYPGGFVGISDLPIEWMDIDGVPLCFAKDVCRIPETGITNVLSQFARNNFSSYRVSTSTPKRSLVICGAFDSDPITHNFLELLELQKDAGTASGCKMERCETLDHFYRLINEFKPELLIIDSHGRYISNESGTEIQIGNEFLNGQNVIDHLPQIPLVILSACWGAPLYGCTNTIAHAFFEIGSFAVTASLLPIRIQRSGLLYTRIMRNLKYATEHAIHPDWASFVCHNIRTSYFDDLLSNVFTRLGKKALLIKERYKQKRPAWQAKTMFEPGRFAAYHDAYTTVSECFDASSAKNIINILNAKSYMPEFMLVVS